MLKTSALKRIAVATIALVIFIFICVIPTNINKTKKNISIIYDESKDTPVYLQDHNDYVSRINISSSESDIKYIVELLTINGKYHSLIPNGFNATIPENTKLLNYEIKDTILYLNFSEELLNVSLQNEEKMIESIIYSLCEFNGIKGIIIKVNGMKLTHLPKSGKALPEVLNYEYGINKTYNLNNIKNTEQVTVYYLSKYNNIDYYIPITKISNTNTSKVEVIVSELKTTPYIKANISSYLKASYELEQYEILENSIKLTFNNELLMGVSDENIEEELKYILTLSIRDTYNIEDITININ